MVLNVEFGVDEVLYLLFLPGFTFFEQVKKSLSLLFGELRGPTAPEARRKESETTLVPEFGPATSGRLRHPNIIGRTLQRCTLVEPFDESEQLTHLLVISFREQAVEIVLTEVTDDLFLPSSHCSTNSEYTYIFCESLLGDVKLVIAEKETDEDEENPVKYLATNKIDAPTEHVIRSYGMRWRIETFFEDSKQDLGLGDCEMQTDEGASRHWHLLMAAYSLVRLDPDSSVLGTVRSKASSLRANLEHSLKEAVYNLLSWVRDNKDRDVDDLMEKIDHLFVHSTVEANVQS